MLCQSKVTTLVTSKLHVRVHVHVHVQALPIYRAKKSVKTRFVYDLLCPSLVRVDPFMNQIDFINYVFKFVNKAAYEIRSTS